MHAIRALSLALLLALPLQAQAFSLFSHDKSDEVMIQPEGKPLMVIRFNQRNVRYERQLYGALEKAVAIKPGILFDVIATSPEATSGSDPDALKEAASANGHRVMNSLISMGVPKSRIHYAELTDPTTRFSEVRIYVK
jgi:hypothetical protein